VSRDPGRGSPGYRGAPARGVDVKPPLREPGTGLPGPLRGPGGVQKGLRTLSGSPGWPGGPGRAPGPVPDPAPRGVLHQPLAPGPRGTGRGSPGSPGVPDPSGVPKPQICPFLGKIGQKPPKWGFPGEDPKKPFLGYRGAPARGVDVKPPLAGPEKGVRMAKKAIFGEKGQFWPFWPKKPDFGHFGGFRPPRGLPRPPPSEGFTSTPRVGAPRFPGGGVGSQRRPGAGRSPKGARGSPPGRSREDPGCPWGSGAAP